MAVPDPAGNPAEKIEPTISALPEIPANDIHGKVVEHYAQAASEPAEPAVWQARPPRRSWFFQLMKRIAKPFLKIQRVPDANQNPPFDPSKPVLYVLEYAGLSNLLILGRRPYCLALPS